MKKLTLFAFGCLVPILLLSQIPQGFNYQAVARDASGDILASTSLTVRISILQNSTSGPLVWEGYHMITTNSYGLFSIIIGQGTGGLTEFSEINWSSGNFFLKVEVDDGNGMINMGTSQILSVPLALHASTALHSDTAKHATTSEHATTAEALEGAVVPKGSIIMWSGSVDVNGNPLVGGVPDTNWYVCNGNNGTPDLRDRFIIGAGGAYTTGSTGGMESITLSESNLPEHKHYFSRTTSTDGEHVHPHDDRVLDHLNVSRINRYVTLSGTNLVVSVSPSFRTDSPNTDPGGSHDHTVSGNTSSTGDGVAFSILPPYYALAFLMYDPD